MERPPSSSNQLPWLGIILASAMAVATLQAEGASAPLVEQALNGLADASAAAADAPGADDALAQLPARRLGVDPQQWRPSTLLSYVGLHSGVWHLTGNLLLLLLLCAHLESALGGARVALLVLCGTLGAGFCFASLGPEDGHVLIGSSGLLAGLLAVFCWTLRESRGEGFYALTLVGGTLWLVLPPWMGVPWSQSYPGVELLGTPLDARLSYWGYAGGLVGALSAYGAGALLGRRPTPEVERAARARPPEPSITLEDVFRQRETGRDDVAYQQLLLLLRQQPEHLDAAILLAEVAKALGREDKADEAMLRAIRIEAQQDQTAAAVRHWLDLTLQGIPRAADPVLLVRIASLLRHHEHPETASLALREALARAEGPSAATVAARVARASQELEPRLAHDAAWRALGSPEISLEERQSLEDLLAVVLPRLSEAETGAAAAPEKAAPSEAGSAFARPGGIEVDGARIRVLDAVRAIPEELDDEGIHIATRGGSKKRVLYERIEAVSVAAIAGLADKPVLVLDLVLDWRETLDDRLRVIRMRGDEFDPRRLVAAESSLEAVRELVSTLLERAQALALPDRSSVLGGPFASFEDLASYERHVLLAESPLSQNDS